MTPELFKMLSTTWTDFGGFRGGFFEILREEDIVRRNIEDGSWMTTRNRERRKRVIEDKNVNSDDLQRAEKIVKIADRVFRVDRAQRPP